jgi:antirestriction protein ArdC
MVLTIGSTLYYSSSKDEIHLPSKNQFEDAGKYYATALHHKPLGVLSQA